jgi:nucleotide-binding universal stress UspA family protein
MKRFKNILYVSEAGVDQASAIGRAISLAESNQAQLTVIEVIPPGSDPAGRRPALESLTAPARQDREIRIEVRPGRVFLEVIRAVLRNGHDLVIKAAENPDFLQRIFGSDDMHLLRKCPCPVWLMKPPEKPNYGCIVAAIGFNPLTMDPVEQALNQEILELAGSLALSDSAALHLVHAWEAYAEGAMRSRSDKAVEEIDAYVEDEHLLHQNALHGQGQLLRTRIGAEAYDYISPVFHLPKGPAQRTIANLAADLQADLVVMGTIARTGISGFIIGNTAESILDQLTCSVLAVKPPGFVTPVKPD